MICLDQQLSLECLVIGALGLGLPLQSHSLQQTILVVQHHISASGKLETVVLFSSGFLG